MGRLLADLAERTRFSVKLTLAEADALAAVAARWPRPDRDLDSAVRRVRQAASRKRAAVGRIAGGR